MSEEAAADRIELVSDIVSAYVSKNNVPPGELPGLIRSVYQSLGSLGKPAEPEPVKLTPPVPIKRSVTPDHIISLEDGKAYKSLKRHLTTRGLTPAEYAATWTGTTHPHSHSKWTTNRGPVTLVRRKPGEETDLSSSALLGIAGTAPAGQKPRPQV